jgi:hypothetical protein
MAYLYSNATLTAMEVRHRLDTGHLLTPNCLALKPVGLEQFQCVLSRLPSGACKVSDVSEAFAACGVPQEYLQDGY